MRLYKFCTNTDPLFDSLNYIFLSNNGFMGQRFCYGEAVLGATDDLIGNDPGRHKAGGLKQRGHVYLS